ncbi:MAG: matrixin family metalloprotease [Labilithrix sp.]|nr:matrixin family metalloprotease [Labilithrix sp.]MCW5809697.1 matrixin family metalloprotease [Labilithrix sp.]
MAGRRSHRGRARRGALLAAALGLSFGLSLVLTSGGAHAFCRTRTEKVAADHDATKLGCKLDGVPLFWKNTCVGYSIQGSGSKRISYEEAANGMSQAFTRWTGATCPADANGRTRPSIDVRDLGPVDCARVEYVSGAANQNVIIFRDESWPHAKTTYGLVTTRFDAKTGELYGADMELNMFDMDPLAVRDPVAPNEYDFLSVATHEAGHFLGLNHSDVVDSTMYAYYGRGQTQQRILRPDDIEGICTIYRPDGVRTVLDQQVLAGGQCDPTPRGGYSTQCEEPSCAAAPGPPRRADTAWLVGLTALLHLARRSRFGSRNRMQGRR